MKKEIKKYSPLFRIGVTLIIIQIISWITYGYFDDGFPRELSGGFASLFWNLIQMTIENALLIIGIVLIIVASVRKK